jgi:hypothetical protein
MVKHQSRFPIELKENNNHNIFTIEKRKKDFELKEHRNILPASHKIY